MRKKIYQGQSKKKNSADDKGRVTQAQQKTTNKGPRGRGTEADGTENY